MAILRGDVFISKLRKFRLSFAVFQYSSIPVFQSFFSLHIPLSFANFITLAKNIGRSADHRCIFILIFLLIYFVCIKDYLSSDSGPAKENFMKRVQIQDDEAAQCQRWWRARKQEIAWASYVRVVFISRIFIHTVRKEHFATLDWTEAGATKWIAFYLDRKIMLIFRIGLQSCQILVIFVKCDL